MKAIGNHRILDTFGQSILLADLELFVRAFRIAFALRIQLPVCGQGQIQAGSSSSFCNRRRTRAGGRIMGCILWRKRLHGTGIHRCSRLRDCSGLCCPSGIGALLRQLRSPDRRLLRRYNGCVRADRRRFPEIDDGRGASSAIRQVHCWGRRPPDKPDAQYMDQDTCSHRQQDARRYGHPLIHLGNPSNTGSTTHACAPPLKAVCPTAGRITTAALHMSDKAPDADISLYRARMHSLHRHGAAAIRQHTIAADREGQFAGSPVS